MVERAVACRGTTANPAIRHAQGHKMRSDNWIMSNILPNSLGPSPRGQHRRVHIGRFVGGHAGQPTRWHTRVGESWRREEDRSRRRESPPGKKGDWQKDGIRGGGAVKADALESMLGCLSDERSVKKDCWKEPTVNKWAHT